MIDLAFAPGPTCAQQINPIVAATQAPPIAARNIFGMPVYYGSPYGNPYPYQSANPALQPMTTQQPNPNPTVPAMPSSPGQIQVPSGGGGGGGGGGSAGGGGGAAPPVGSNNAEGASYDLLKDPNSPLYKRYESINPAVAQIRPQVLAENARGRGIRRGFVEEARRIAASLETNDAVRLDGHYDFTRVMIGAHLVPPVIAEIRNVQEHAGDRLLYLTLGAFEIVKPARLVVQPPNWRNYLYLDVTDPDTTVPALQPQTSDEQSVYDQAYAAGIEKGIAEARASFEDNLNRLDRDYTGMERYHELAQQGAVSLPVVQDSKRSVRIAEGGKRAFIGEQVVTLRVTPKFRAARKAAYR